MRNANLFNNVVANNNSKHYCYDTLPFPFLMIQLYHPGEMGGAGGRNGTCIINETLLRALILAPFPLFIIFFFAFIQDDFNIIFHNLKVFLLGF